MAGIYGLHEICVPIHTYSMYILYAYTEWDIVILYSYNRISIHNTLYKHSMYTTLIVPIFAIINKECIQQMYNYDHTTDVISILYWCTV